jgi:hypothetical protein
MHCLPNQTTVKRYRLAALLILLKWLLITGSLPLFGYALLVDRRDLSYLAIGLWGFAGFVAVSHWMTGARARCPLCLVPSFSHLQQSKSTKAKQVFGSYRFFVALGVIFKGCFHCPYCAKDVAVRTRQHRDLSAPEWAPDQGSPRRPDFIPKGTHCENHLSWLGTCFFDYSPHDQANTP